MQLLLSLDTALQLIQADRDCLKRVQTFIRYPGTYGRKVRDAIEEVFIILLQTLGDKHVVPAFKRATKEMGEYKPEEHDEEGTTVAPLVQFFELVHIGDTIHQMVDAYFEKEMVSFCFSVRVRYVRELRFDLSLTFNFLHSRAPAYVNLKTGRLH